VIASAEYRAVFEAAPDGIVVVDAGGRISDLNPRAEEQFGYAREELLGQSIEILVPDGQRDIHREQRDDYMRRPATRPMGAAVELVGRRRDGSTFPVEISLSPVETEAGVFVVSVVRDVTERNRLRDFGVTALRAAEDERQRIARELHDDTAQRLAALLVRLQVASREEDAEARGRQLEEIREEILRAAEEVRRIARGLRPPVLDEMGVVAALRSHVATLAKVYSLEIELESEGEPRMGADAELALYRIVQEALANVVRHSGAESARVRLDAKDGRVLAVVEDDGRGFDPARSAGGGLGLTGMHERARHAGGTLSIESVPGEGTRVRVEIPSEGR
jgi:PAS domain S-box-containing protein